MSQRLDRLLVCPRLQVHREWNNDHLALSTLDRDGSILSPSKDGLDSVTVEADVRAANDRFIGVRIRWYVSEGIQGSYNQDHREGIHTAAQTLRSFVELSGALRSLRSNACPLAPEHGDAAVVLVVGENVRAPEGRRNMRASWYRFVQCRAEQAHQLVLEPSKFLQVRFRLAASFVRVYRLTPEFGDSVTTLIGSSGRSRIVLLLSKDLEEALEYANSPVQVGRQVVEQSRHDTVFVDVELVVTHFRENSLWEDACD
ncbi:MAG: hypothetical protein OXU81_04320 [Gammaproteobacteria bacterium]|nr:hypothetical protein [Gammaproteobacteria bacterium]